MPHISIGIKKNGKKILYWPDNVWVLGKNCIDVSSEINDYFFGKYIVFSQYDYTFKDGASKHLNYKYLTGWTEVGDETHPDKEWKLGAINEIDDFLSNFEKYTKLFPFSENKEVLKDWLIGLKELVLVALDKDLIVFYNGE